MKELKWGETPWDNLSQEELLREVQRMFAALQAAKSVMGLLSVQSNSTFWSEHGSGGRALEFASQVIDPVYKEYDDESVYKSFFRYAVSLLFEVSDDEKWIICPVCGGMWGGRNAISYIGTVCSEHPMTPHNGCKGVFRWLEWKDLEK